VVEQNATKGVARLAFCVTRTAEQAVSANRLLGEVNIVFITDYYYFP
jgi:hypothetical protein